MNRKTLSLALGVAIVAGAVPLSAQNANPCSAQNAAQGCSVNVATSVTVPDILQLDLSTLNTVLSSPTAANFTAGFRDDPGPTATVTANRSWKVTVNSGGATFSGPYAKPASDLKWGGAACSSAPTACPNAMGTAATLFQLATGTASAAQQIFYRTLYNWTNDQAGTYSITVVFSITQP